MPKIYFTRMHKSFSSFKRFDDKTIDSLLELKWWDWDEEKITKYLNTIRNADPETLKKA